MSHPATRWAIRQKGLKPATKIVLWHLADRHNPDYGCFPEQALLAADCEMSKASLNEHLNILEKKGLICREKRWNHRTKKQMSTLYTLAFEEGFAASNPCPNSGHGAVSRKKAKPCPENAESRVQNLDTNLVKEPLKEPVRICSAQKSSETGLTKAEMPVLQEQSEAPDHIRFFAEKISAGRYVAPSTVRPDQARMMLAHKLVTQTALREAGIQW